MGDRLQLDDLGTLSPDELFRRLSPVGAIVAHGLHGDLLGMELVSVALAPLVGPEPWTAPPTLKHVTARLLKVLIDEYLLLRLGEPEARARHWGDRLTLLQQVKAAGSMRKSQAHSGGMQGRWQGLQTEGLIMDVDGMYPMYTLTPAGAYALRKLEEYAALPR